MAYSLSYFDKARTDIRETKKWYKKQQLGLEKRFADSVKSTIHLIQNNPFRFAVRHHNLRMAHTKTFPYGIHFYIDDSNHEIVIVAILHNKRHPNTALKRF